MDGPHDGSATCAILLTDLVESTARRAGLGEEAADRWAIDVERRVRDLVRARRGWVVKGTGDGVLAAFDSAADALAAAVVIQQRAEHPRRIGVSIGDVTWQQRDCFGQPVIEAARLVAAAGPGEILVADLVRLMARGRGGYVFEPAGALELKGLAEPLATARLLWKALPAEPAVRVPLPSPLRTEHGLRFVGRGHELARLGAAWARARSGARQAVFVSGEPGAGKTRLAVQFAREAHRDGAIVLFAGSDERVASPYQPVLEALTHLVDDAGVDRLGSAASPSDAETERQRLFGSVYERPAAHRGRADRLAPRRHAIGRSAIPRSATPPSATACSPPCCSGGCATISPRCGRARPTCTPTSRARIPRRFSRGCSSPVAIPRLRRGSSAVSGSDTGGCS